jgi:hypothetical protein
MLDPNKHYRLRALSSLRLEHLVVHHKVQDQTITQTNQQTQT